MGAVLDDAVLLLEGDELVPADEPVPVVPDVLPFTEGEALVPALPEAPPPTDGDIVPLVELDIPPLTEPLAEGLVASLLPEVEPLVLLDELPGPAVGAMPPGVTVLPLALLPVGGQSCEPWVLPLVPPLGELPPAEPPEPSAKATGASPKATARASVRARNCFIPCHPPARTWRVACI